MKEGQPNPITETRNSWIRAKTKGTVERGVRIARKNEYLRQIPTEAFNATVVIGAAIGSYFAYKANIREDYKDEKDRFKEQSKPAVLLTVTALADYVDGTWAREIEREKPGTVDFTRGGAIDAGADRLSETIMGIFRIIYADKKGDWIGKLTALAATVTSPSPSRVRAEVESHGIVLPEAGKSILGFFGTRVGRAIDSISATSYPEIKIPGHTFSIPVQPVLDIITTVSNVKTTIDRRNALQEASKLPKKPDSQKTKEEIEKETQLIEDAKARIKVFDVLEAVTFAAALIAYSRHKKS
ncbi:MAG: hypothetical protein Q7K55_01785 [Candidatus Levybacteria bacterium]|nr:hypothetical protein [Candidatus Levybacteria bacterium]